MDEFKESLRDTSSICDADPAMNHRATIRASLRDLAKQMLVWFLREIADEKKTDNERSETQLNLLQLEPPQMALSEPLPRTPRHNHSVFLRNIQTDLSQLY